MKSNIKPLFYMKCWLEMKIFLTEVVRDDAEGYPYAQDILNCFMYFALKPSKTSLDFLCKIVCSFEPEMEPQNSLEPRLLPHLSGSKAYF